jgi:hypothetical protein
MSDPSEQSGTGVDEGFDPSAWHADLPESFQNPEARKVLSKYTDREAAIQGLLDAQKLIGTSIRLPSADAGDEEKSSQLGKIMDKLRSLRGVPESVEGYGTFKPKDLAKGLKWDEDFEQQIVELAHKHHVPQAALAEFFTAQMVKQQDKLQRLQAAADAEKEAAEKSLTEAKKALKTQWGKLYDANVESAQRMLDHYESELSESKDLSEFLNANPNLRNHPAFVRFMHQMWQQVGAEGGAIEGSTLAGVKEAGFFGYKTMDT